MAVIERTMLYFALSLLGVTILTLVRLVKIQNKHITELSANSQELQRGWRKSIELHVEMLTLLPKIETRIRAEVWVAAAKRLSLAGREHGDKNCQHMSTMIAQEFIHEANDLMKEVQR